MDKFISFLFNSIPAIFLPAMPKITVNAKTGLSLKKELTHEEKRDALKRSFYHKINSCLLVQKIYQYAENSERKKHFYLIGELTVSFSNLEQNIKSMGRRLISDSVTNDEFMTYNFSAGEALKKKTKKYVKASSLDADIKEKIYTFLKKFDATSKERNQLIKCAYGYNAITQKVSIIHWEKFDSQQRKTNGMNNEELENFFDTLSEDFDASRCSKCLTDIENLNQNLIEILCKMIARKA